MTIDISRLNILPLNLLPEMLESWLPDGRLEGKEWVALNPTREDKNPGSFKINIETGQWSDFATEESGNNVLSLAAYLTGLNQVEAAQLLLNCRKKQEWPDLLDVREANNVSSLSKKPATAQPEILRSGCTLEHYAKAKQLPVDFLLSLGLQEATYLQNSAVRIPYLDQDGQEVAVRFRTRLEGSDRFRWRKGTKPCLYGLWRLNEAKKNNSLVLVEGESDCQTLWLHGIPTLGLPGVGNWREENDAAFFKDVSTIFVWIEPDRGGEAMLEWLRRSEIRDKARLLFAKDFKDANAMHCADPDGFSRHWGKALQNSVPWDNFEDGEKSESHKSAWDQCAELAKEPRILERFSEALESAGVVGESKMARILYLALTSRVLSRPVSIAVKGPSSGGKSYITGKVLSFFPAEAFYALTAMSEKALAYSEEPMSHRFVVIYEAEGMQGDFSSYLIRSLLSEGRIRYETVEKTAQGMSARLIEREGPTGLLVTTTAARLHPENETRMFSLTVTDTPEQTRNIFLNLAEGKKDDVDRTAWYALQTWLATGERRVVIPFAGALVAKIPPLSVRLRRDVEAVLNLVHSHALLHQENRQRDDKGQIMATREDYAVVRDLVGDIVGEGVEAQVSLIVRETVQAVKELKDDGDRGFETLNSDVTCKEVADKLGIDKSSASRRIKVALQKGYLINNEDRPYKPLQLNLGDSLPEELEVLPPVDGI